MSYIPPWLPSTWRDYPLAYAFPYTSADEEQLHLLTRELAAYPPLVSSHAIQMFQQAVARVSSKDAFILQAGDCAEPIAPRSLKAYVEMMTLLSHQLEDIFDCTIIPVGRIAGQYAKARTTLYEVREEVSLPSYYGDMINRLPFTAVDRTPTPSYMKEAYYAAKATMGQLVGTDVYTSHEALLLPYEEGLTRYDPETEAYYDTSAHMVWVGERTRSVEGAHVAFLRGISNPVGVKLGPHATVDMLHTLADILNPHNMPGRLWFITRLGATHVAALLPQWIRAMEAEGREIIWLCDPMHGNIKRHPSGYKTRYVADIIAELQNTVRIHQAEGSWLGGLHLEITADTVTECVGINVPEDTVPHAYHSLCDPRLNAAQAMAFIEGLALSFRGG